MPDSETLNLLKKGTVIPAHPLALTAERKLDERYQRALTRYYLAAGAGGLAVGVHTTQFAIRDPKIGLFEPVLKLAADEAKDFEKASGKKILKIAGLCGKTAQAVKEAETVSSMGYQIGLLSLAAMKDADDDGLIAHCESVAKVMPLMGFYLQPAVGGRPLGFSFWKRFASIPNVIAIKMAPFNRYQTLDVVRGVAESGRTDVVLYTGNDDHIVTDLLTDYKIRVSGKTVTLPIKGGLLGHWAVWTRKAAKLLEECHNLKDLKASIPPEMMSRAVEVTDSNSAFFDATNNFAGCIAGIHEVLRRQGLMKGLWTLDPNEKLSPGQSEEIDRVYAAYPHLNDDAFVAEHLDEWLS